MRKIEKKMCEAIKTKTNFRSGNTDVTIVDGYDPVVKLHGNIIAKQFTATNIWVISLCGWNTATTRSRLRAIMGEFNIGHLTHSKGITTIHCKNGTKAELYGTKSAYIHHESGIIGWR